MRQLIDGKIYDTDHATLIGDTGGHWIGTFDGGGLYIQEKLYRTKGGNFFVLHRCPRAPGITGWMATGGFHSDWEIRPTSKKKAQRMIYHWDWSFEKAGIKKPSEVA